jgi:3-oxoacyl-[acyl-carrier protein] reductase
MAGGGRLSGSTAIVTGASEGIAEAIARRLAREGARVALVSRSLAHTQRVAAEIEAAGGTAFALEADVTQSGPVVAMVKAVLHRWGGVDILVNGVGGFTGHAPIGDIPEREWDSIFTLNVKSAFLCVQAVIGPMKEKRRGSIINIGSMSGSAPAAHSHSYLPYAAAKAALIGFTKHLAHQVGEFGITVNAVSPSTTLTARARQNKDAGAIERIASHSAMKCLIDVQDTADAVLFLASSEARHITGVNLNVNAGTMIV